MHSEMRRPPTPALSDWEDALDSQLRDQVQTRHRSSPNARRAPHVFDPVLRVARSLARPLAHGGAAVAAAVVVFTAMSTSHPRTGNELGRDGGGHRRCRRRRKRGDFLIPGRPPHGHPGSGCRPPATRGCPHAGGSRHNQAPRWINGCAAEQCSCGPHTRRRRGGDGHPPPQGPLTPRQAPAPKPPQRRTSCDAWTGDAARRRARYIRCWSPRRRRSSRSRPAIG